MVLLQVAKLGTAKQTPKFVGKKKCYKPFYRDLICSTLQVYKQKKVLQGKNEPTEQLNNSLF